MSYVPDYDFDFERIKDTQSLFKVEKTGKSTGFLISSIIKKHGDQCINSLNKAGFNFGNIEGSVLKYIIDNNGIKSIELLKDVGADYSKLDGSDIISIAIKYGKDSFQLLKDAGDDVQIIGEHEDYN